MTFYNEFSRHYETIFPYRPQVFKFLDSWLPVRGKFLDLGCGTGANSARLDAGRRTCLGTDLDAEMIRQARVAYPDTDFMELGMADLATLDPERFDGVFCVGNVLPHLPGNRLPGFLESLKGLLRPGGRWILQTVNFDTLAGKTQHDFPDREFPDQELVFRRRYTDITTESLVFQTSLLRAGRQVFSGQVTLCPMASEVLLAHHLAAGFKLTGHFGDFSGTGFESATSPANIMVFAAD